MKARNTLPFIIAALLLPFCIVSCGEDRWAYYNEQTETDRWIEDTMRVWYYWKDEMPDDDDLNYFSKPSTFLSSLCADDDDYSSIDSLLYTNDYSYGIRFITQSATDSTLYALVRYVIDDSPAAEASLDRGDWIMEIDGEPLTSSNYKTLYGSSSLQLTVGYYDAETDSIIAYDGTLTLPEARTISDNPVHYSNIYTVGTKTVGYLVYNHFTAGTTDASTQYDDALRSAFATFSARQVDEFILDLRYNDGGAISSVQLLASMLVPSSALGQTMSRQEYNSNFGTKTVTFDSSLIESGANLNLSNIYILTSDDTSGLSEMLINVLSPYMNVTLIGKSTDGKNFGLINFENAQQMISLSLAVCRVYNANGETNESGFSADYSANETSDWATFLPFGNTDELLLSTALELIE